MTSWWRRMLRYLVGGVDVPPVPVLSEDQIAREGELNNIVQRAVSSHSVARHAIREGNGRVIALLTEAVGGAAQH